MLINQNIAFKQKTVAAIIIGDEILTGKVKDENVFILSKFLFEQGLCLHKVEIIPDIIDEIAAVVYRLSNNFDYVFTSGGIGPTHDDKTYESVAKAFGLHLEYNKNLCNINGNKEEQKIFTFPKSCKIIYTNAFRIPLVVVKNVYIFPGVPKLFSGLLYAVKDHFIGRTKKRVLIYTKKTESKIATILAKIQSEYPDVAIGSYPKYNHNDYRVMISLECFSVDLIKKVSNKVKIAIDGF